MSLAGKTQDPASKAPAGWREHCWIWRVAG